MDLMRHRRLAVTSEIGTLEELIAARRLVGGFGPRPLLTSTHTLRQMLVQAP